jgi:hypothetical protein
VAICLSVPIIIACRTQDHIRFCRNGLLGGPSRSTIRRVEADANVSKPLVQVLGSRTKYVIPSDGGVAAPRTAELPEPARRSTILHRCLATLGFSGTRHQKLCSNEYTKRRTQERKHFRTLSEPGNWATACGLCPCPTTRLANHPESKSSTLWEGFIADGGSRGRRLLHRRYKVNVRGI